MTFNPSLFYYLLYVVEQWSSIGGPGPHPAHRPPICGPQTVIPSLCVLVGSARVYRDLSPCQWYTDNVLLGHSLLRAQFLTFIFIFWSSSHIDILLAVGAKIAWKWSVPSSLFKENWTVKIGSLKKNGLKFAFILRLTSTRSMCSICQETIAVMKISNLKRHYEMKHRNFEETFP